MEIIEKYTYSLRPGYGSDKLLIEFLSGVERERFIVDLLNVLAEINPHLADVKDLWMNDEILLEMKSDIGPFVLSKDVWGLAFIMSDENQQGLRKIDSVLLNDSRFEKRIRDTP